MPKDLVFFEAVGFHEMPDEDLGMLKGLAKFAIPIDTELYTNGVLVGDAFFAMAISTVPAG